MQPRSGGIRGNHSRIPLRSIRATNCNRHPDGAQRRSSPVVPNAA